MLFREERRPGRGRGGGEIRWRVHSQVDQDPAVSAADNHPAERVTIVDPLGHPASLAGRGLQGVACGWNMPALRGGEEVEVLGGPCREMLCEQRCSLQDTRSAAVTEFLARTGRGAPRRPRAAVRAALSASSAF